MAIQYVISIAANTAQAASQLAALNQAVSTLTTQLQRAGGTSASRGLQQVGSSASSATSGVQSLTGALGRLAAAAGGIALLVDQFEKLVKAATTSERIFQTLKFSTGSSEAAAEQLQFVTQQANRLGLALPEVATEYGKLSAAAKGTDFKQDDIQQLFLGLTEYATVLKVGTEDVKGSMTALVQMLSKGKVSSEELRQQLGERLPGAFALAAKASGKTTAEFTKLLDTGQVESPSFLRLMARQLREAAEKDLPEATDSLQSNLNRMETAIFQFRANVVKAGAGEAIKQASKDLTEALDNPQLAQFAGVLGAAFLQVQAIGAKVFASMGEAVFQFGYGTAVTVSKIREFFGDMASGILRVWNTLMTNLKLKMADLIDGFATGISKLPLVGDDIEKKARDGAAYLRASAQMNKTIVDALGTSDKARKSYEQDFRQGVKDARNAAALAMLQDGTGASIKTPGIDKNPGPLKLAKGNKDGKANSQADKLRNAQLAFDEALAEQRKKLAEATAMQEQKQLEVALAKKELTEKQYLERTTAAKQAALDDEFKAQEDLIAKLQTAKNGPHVDKAEATRLDAEITKATTKLVEIGNKKLEVGFDAEKGLEDLRQKTADFRLELTAEIKDAEGHPLEAQLAQIAEKFRKLRLQYADDPVALGLINKREGQEKNTAGRNEAERQLGFIDKRQSLAEDALQQKFNDGLLTTLELQQQLGEARLKSAAAMEVELARLRDLLVQNPGDVGLSLAIDELAAKVTNLKKPVADFWKDFNQASGSAFEGALKSAQNFSDLWMGTLQSILTYLRDYFAKQAGEMLTKALNGGGSSGSGIDFSAMFSKLKDGLSSLLSSLGSALQGLLGGINFGGIASMFGFATGGYTGPGGKYDPAGIVHKDEFVFDTPTVSAFGLPLLHYMWRNKKLPPGYSSGGPVGGGAGGGLGQLAPSGAGSFNPNFNANLYLDADAAADATLRSRTGEARVVEIMVQNKGKLR